MVESCSPLKDWFVIRASVFSLPLISECLRRVGLAKSGVPGGLIKFSVLGKLVLTQQETLFVPLFTWSVHFSGYFSDAESRYKKPSHS